MPRARRLTIEIPTHLRNAAGKPLFPKEAAELETPRGRDWGPNLSAFKEK